MARKKDPALDALEKKAVELGLKGVRPKAIKTRLRLRQSVGVVTKWLRDAGVRRAVRARVVEMAAESKPEDVAAALELSTRRVQQILREANGPARERRSPEQLVDLFLSDPYTYMTATFTRSQGFGRALVKRCAKAVVANPKTGLFVVEPCIELFDRNRKNTRLKDKKRRWALCFNVQCRGIEAHAYELSGHFRTAEEKLQGAFDAADGCMACEAEELWRLGRLYHSWKRCLESESAIEGALRRYLAFPDSGHDLLGNGIANCMLVRSGCLYHTVSPEAGAVEARNALKKLTGKESPLLFAMLVVALAKYLQASRDPRSVDEAQALLDWCFDHLRIASSHPVGRLYLYMLKGHLLAVKGRRDDAIESLTVALEAAQACEHVNEIGLILADLGLLDPDPRNLRSHIEDFCDWDDNGELILPQWCRSLESEIRSLYDQALSAETEIDDSVFVALREAAGGEARMPTFIVPPPPAGGPQLQARL